MPARPLPAPEDEHGVRRKGAAKDRLWARVSRFYFDDRIEPVTPAELAAAHSHGGHDAIDAGEEQQHPAAIETH